MLASSSPPKVSRLRHGPRSSPTTAMSASASTLAAVAPDAPAPMMQTSARAGFLLTVTIGLPVFLGLAIGEPIQRAEAALVDLVQGSRSGKADRTPSRSVVVAAVDRVGVTALARMHDEERKEFE